MVLCLWGGTGAAADEKTAPNPELSRTVRVAPGPRYQANALHRWLLGAGYRKLWTTPIAVEVLDLETFSGGLVVDKKGGGKQTKSLRFKGADGREWKVRSVDKDPTPVVPKALQRTLVDGIVQDQTGASLPANGPMVDRLSEAAGVLHVKRRLVVLPDDPRLGEFRQEFAGLLGTLEEIPRLEAPVTPGFDGVTRLLDNSELGKLVEADPRERVDARALLRARLLDTLIGDYDRHGEQWDWARTSGGRWVPVPKDRDLAFVKFDGLAIDFVRLVQPRLVKFGAEYPSVMGLVWQSRFLDRRHLAELEWPAWEEVVADFQARLTNAVIDEAARQLPPPYYEHEGSRLASQLKARRAALPAFARSFYEMLAREAEVHATDAAETAQLSRLADGSLEVQVAGPEGPYFRRRFRADETREVRVFLKGGDDRAVSEGRGDPGVKVRLVGGEGNDVLNDSAGGHTRFYDSSGENQVSEGPGTRQDSRPYTSPLGRDDNPVRDWGSSRGVSPWIRGGGGYGLVLGAAFERIDYGFRRHPFARRQAVRLGYSTLRRTGGVHYDFESLRTDNRARFQVAARVSELETIHFYGFGNETARQEPKSFHDVRQTLFLLAPSYRFDLTALDISLGPVVKFSDTRLPGASLIALQRPPGVDPYGQVGARLAFDLDRHAELSTSPWGAQLTGEGAFYPRLWSVREAFGEVQGRAAVFLGAPVALRPTLALRAGGQRVFGRYPFHEAAYIGHESVRGLPRQRYAGDASVYGNGELRILLRRRDDAFLSQLGVFGLADAGRVFLESESSDRWHTAVGGGVWLSLSSNTVSFSVARSEGQVRVYLQGGLMF